jgi:hypothetical protein
VKVQLPVGISSEPPPSGFSWLHGVPTDNWYLLNVEGPVIPDPNEVARRVHSTVEYLQALGDILPQFP